MTNDQASWAEARTQAEALLQAISASEAVIVTTIERECEAIRSGCMLAARALHTRLCDAAKFYVDGIKSARASLAALEEVLPGSQEYLEKQREAFSALLKVELAVLASEYAACGASGQAMSFTGETLLGSAVSSPAKHAGKADPRSVAKRDMPNPGRVPRTRVMQRFGRA